MKLRYEQRYPPTVNHARETEIAATAAASLVGENNVKREFLPSMAAEDFACFLEKQPGAYIWLGNGSAESGGMLHSPHYDFNDSIRHWAQAIGCVLLSRCSQRIEPHWESAEYLCAVSLK
jgi:hippurate hydrolase